MSQRKLGFQIEATACEYQAPYPQPTDDILSDALEYFSLFEEQLFLNIKITNKLICLTSLLQKKNIKALAEICVKIFYILR